MARINISIIQPDKTLARSLDKIANVRQVGGAFTVQRANGEINGVREIAQGTPANERPLQLDLIAHARDGVLHLARWVISESETESDDVLAGLTPETLAAIRLLGCFTGQTKAGRAAMRHLKQKLITKFGEAGKKIKVFGTRNLTGAKDFDNDGFRVDHEPLLVEHDQLPEPGQEGVVDEAAWVSDWEKASAADLTVERLQPESEAGARAEAARYEAPSRWDVRPSGPQHGALAAVLANRDGDPWVDPGLLQLPDFEILFPAPPSSDAPRCFRVTSLFGGKYLRVYPSDQPGGVLFRPKRPLAE